MVILLVLVLDKRTMKQKVKFMADYHCDPLWLVDEEKGLCIPTWSEKFPISQSLQQDLNTWQTETDALYDIEYTLQERVPQLREIEWKRQGYLLYERVKTELANTEFELDINPDWES